MERKKSWQGVQERPWLLTSWQLGPQHSLEKHVPSDLPSAWSLPLLRSSRNIRWRPNLEHMASWALVRSKLLHINCLRAHDNRWVLCLAFSVRCPTLSLDWANPHTAAQTVSSSSVDLEKNGRALLYTLERTGMKWSRPQVKPWSEAKEPPQEGVLWGVCAIKIWGKNNTRIM